MVEKPLIKPAYTPFIVLVSAAGIGLVFYLSWLPEPRLSQYGFLPGWLARWTDAEVNENLRTAVPLVGLGLLAGLWLTKTKQNWSGWVVAWFGLVLIVVVAELGQLMIPRRNFDWADIAWGAVGAMTGLFITLILVTSVRLLQQLRTLQ